VIDSRPNGSAEAGIDQGIDDDVAKHLVKASTIEGRDRSRNRSKKLQEKIGTRESIKEKQPTRVNVGTFKRQQDNSGSHRASYCIKSIGDSVDD
jgi:hypothetical protein